MKLALCTGTVMLKLESRGRPINRFGPLISVDGNQYLELGSNNGSDFVLARIWQCNTYYTWGYNSIYYNLLQYCKQGNRLSHGPVFFVFTQTMLLHCSGRGKWLKIDNNTHIYLSGLQTQHKMNHCQESLYVNY